MDLVLAPAPEELPADPWPIALSGHRPLGQFRITAKDFQVEEILPFAFGGEGPHFLLGIRKEGVTTDRVAQDLASRAGCRLLDVGYAGRKDRKAVAYQHFTVPADRDLGEPATWMGPSWRVLATGRCRRKLRRGVHVGNGFRLRLALDPIDRPIAVERFQEVLTRGVPNYFGPQRFGREGGNLVAACRWLTDAVRVDRRKQGLYLSAARSYLFNQVLAARISEETWDQLIPGELALLAGKRAGFQVVEPQQERGRLVTGDLHPSGPLPGVGGLSPTARAAVLEEAVLAEQATLVAAIRSQEVKVERRALRVLPAEGGWEQEPTGLWLMFRLPPGSFATSVVREVIRAERMA